VSEKFDKTDEYSNEDGDQDIATIMLGARRLEHYVNDRVATITSVSRLLHHELVQLYYCLR
jgi:hypothetical protein